MPSEPSNASASTPPNQPSAGPPTEGAAELSDRPNALEEIDLEAEIEEEGTGASPWAIAVGIAVLLVIGVGGWGLWRILNPGQPEGGAAMAEMPPAPAAVVPVGVGTVLETSQLVGTLSAARRVTLRPEVEGRIVRQLVESGQPVAAGQPMFQLSPQKRQAELGGTTAALESLRAASNRSRADARTMLAELRARQADLAALQQERQGAIADLTLQVQDFERTEQLVDEGAIERRELDLRVSERDRAAAQVRTLSDRIVAATAAVDAARAQLERAEFEIAEADGRFQQAEAAVGLDVARLRETQLRAPIDGRVGDLAFKLGDFVRPDDAIAEIIDNRTLELRLSVPLERAPQLRPGLPVQISTPQGRVLGTGQVSFISPTADNESQTVLVKVAIPNRDGQLLDGQFVQATVLWSQKPNSVVVPATAVVFQGDRQFVYVVSGSRDRATVRQQTVQVGAVRNGQAEILQGLKPSDAVVATGTQRLFDGAATRRSPINRPRVCPDLERGMEDNRGAIAPPPPPPQATPRPKRIPSYLPPSPPVHPPTRGGKCRWG
jgi:RND family efflux transporter MFP subunit